MREFHQKLINGVMYQLFLRPFTAEGTLDAARGMLPFLHSIGVTIVYLCPLFGEDDDPDPAGWSDRQLASGMNNPKNPYRVSDHFHVDEEYGSDDDLRAFAADAHALGMSVIVDIVYFHCGPRAVFMNEHPEFVLRGEDGKPLVGEWRFPRLDFDNPALRAYLISNMETLVRDFDLDGFRADCGGSIPVDFWEQAREALDRVRTDVILLNEGGDPRWLEKAFDLNYSYSLCTLFRSIVEGDKSASALDGRFYPRVIEFLDNHDTANNDYEFRLEKRVGFDAVNAGLVLNFTLPGVPMLYNGYEVCDTNRHSIWANRFHGKNCVIGWQKALTEEGGARLKLIEKLAAMRAGHEAFGQTGRLSFAHVHGSDKTAAFLRSSEDETFAVLVNLSRETVSVTTGLSALELSPKMLFRAAVSVGGTDGFVRAKLGPFGYAVVRLTENIK